LESRELLSICLKKLKSALARVRLVDASFIWTEPHSKRIKVKVSVQKQVTGGAFLEQNFVVEFKVGNQMCMDCHRVEAKNFWKAVVQVRQDVTRKRTFYYLEQVILKYNMHKNTTKISQQPNGLDFLYGSEQEARKFLEFLNKLLPCTYGKSKKLISHDTHNATYNYKITYQVDLPGVCKDDIVCLPRKMAQQLGNLGQVLICLRVTNNIHLIDFQTLQTAKVPGTHFWRSPFFAVCESKSLTHFTVMAIDKVAAHERQKKSGEGHISKKHVLSDCWVIRTSEMGMHEDFIHTKTHLGHLLNFGDSVMGLDVKHANINNEEWDKLNMDNMYDVILVKKVYDKQVRKRKRKWKLKRMQEETMSTTTDDDNYNQFLEDIEEDEEFRQNINIYAKDGAVEAGQAATGDDQDLPQVDLCEMIQELKIQDHEMEEV